jgi:hypothetical protein
MMLDAQHCLTRHADGAISTAPVGKMGRWGQLQDVRRKAAIPKDSAIVVSPQNKVGFS